MCYSIPELEYYVGQPIEQILPLEILAICVYIKKTNKSKNWLTCQQSEIRIILIFLYKENRAIICFY